MTTDAPILSVSDLFVKRGGVPVLDLPAFSIRKGETVGLIGPNGAGKSTLLLALACLIKRERGRILFHGQVVSTRRETFAYRRRIAVVFQEPLLFDTTVYANVASGLDIRHLDRQEIGERVTCRLDQFGIDHLRNRSARKLSGGEAQRTSLARAFAIDPEIVFLDEPFSSLDPPTREGLLEDLHRILKETGTTAVMATHDRLEALRLSERMAVMRDGEVVQIGPADTIIHHPTDEFVASFVGMETILTGRVSGCGVGTIRVDLGVGELEAVGEARPGEAVRCCIRPENVTLQLPAAREETSARNLFPARVEKIQPLGLFHRVLLDCGFPLTAYVTSQSISDLNLREGAGVQAAFKATAVHVIRHEK